MIGKVIQKTMKQGEKIAPVKSIKLKIKFQKREARVKKALDRKDKK